MSNPQQKKVKTFHVMKLVFENSTIAKCQHNQLLNHIGTLIKGAYTQPLPIGFFFQKERIT
jgi:hypothetical protein